MRRFFRDPELQERFDRDGYVTQDLLTASDIERLTELHDRHSNDLMVSNAWSFTALSQDAAYRELMSDGIRAVLQPRIDAFLEGSRALLGNFFHKLPSSEGSKINMHQDWSWVDERQHPALSVWCPFVPVSEANGTLAVVPGSHRLSEQPRGFVARFPYLELEPVLAAKYSRHLALDAGQAVFFHQRLFHWSGANRSDARRLAANCSFVPVEAKVAFPHPDPQLHPDELELFEIDARLLVSFTPGVRPEGAQSLGRIDAKVDPLDERDLERILGSRAAAVSRD
jgi:hypothetical protein